jgi:hypothetical protein
MDLVSIVVENTETSHTTYGLDAFDAVSGNFFGVILIGG